MDSMWDVCVLYMQLQIWLFMIRSSYNVKKIASFSFIGFLINAWTNISNRFDHFMSFFFYPCFFFLIAWNKATIQKFHVYKDFLNFCLFVGDRIRTDLMIEPRSKALVLNGKPGHLQFYSLQRDKLLYNVRKDGTYWMLLNTLKSPAESVAVQLSLWCSSLCLLHSWT